MQSFLEKNKINIQSQFINICLQKDIDCIILLCKKGKLLFHALFHDLLEDKYLLAGDESYQRYIPVYEDRIINKDNDFSFLSQKKILLFDDSVRTGQHFCETRDYLIKKIHFSQKNEVDFSNFFLYCIAICEDNKYFEKYKKNRYSFYFKSFSYRDYFDFCLKEAYYFQVNLLDNSIDLPVFETYIEDIDLLKTALDNMGDCLQYKEYDDKIGNQKFKVGIVILNKKHHIFQLFDDFLIAPICKIRYAYNNDMHTYKVKFVAYALTDSITYDELTDLYYRIFLDNKFVGKYDERNVQMNFVHLYRYVNYFISYYIGDYLKDLLEAKNITIYYTNNGERQYGAAADYYIKNTINDYDYDLYELMNGYHHASQEKESEAAVSSEFDDINEYIFKKITMNNNIINIKEFTGIFKKDIKSYKNFCYSLVLNQESYAIANEINVKKIDNTWLVTRNFLHGEICNTILPYDGRIFFKGLYNFYKKTKGIYKLYKDNYYLFIDKFYMCLDLLNFFETPLITKKSFTFFEEYFDNVNKENFKEIIESKCYLLDDQETAIEQKLLGDKIDFILTSEDFKFNEEPL